MRTKMKEKQRLKFATISYKPKWQRSTCNISFKRLPKSPTYSLVRFARLSKSPSGKRFSLLLDKFLKVTNGLSLSMRFSMID